MSFPSMVSRIREACLEEYGTGQADPEVIDIAAVLDACGIAVHFVPQKIIDRGRAPLSRSTLVAGSKPFVTGALRQLGLGQPRIEDYPSCLTPFLHRRVWRSTVGEAMRAVRSGTPAPVFIKPALRRLRFGGFVLRGPVDVALFEGASRTTDVYCGEVVEWRSEVRCFVAGGELLGTVTYAGQDVEQPDRDVVDRAIRAYEESGTAPAGYALDIGVLGTGDTALVEVNDAWALGSWRFDSQKYTQCILARWGELTGLWGTRVRHESANP